MSQAMQPLAPVVLAADRAAFDQRPRNIERGVIEQLHYLGNYVRAMPVTLQRMIENAYDWEHLPFVHPSSFAAIAHIDSGSWGWRCKTALAGGGGEQLIELLVDAPNHYWATTVVDGPGKGAQIHTQASACEGGGISVDVRFYSAQPLASREQAALMLGYLQAQYTTLYDEDEALMAARQQALDERRQLRAGVQAETIDLGPEASFERAAIHPAILGDRRIVLRFHRGKWIAHGARCPHALGPLDGATVTPDGRIVCPWHGYSFDLASGAEEHARCGALELLPVEIVQGQIRVSSVSRVGPSAR